MYMKLYTEESITGLIQLILSCQGCSWSGPMHHKPTMVIIASSMYTTKSLKRHLLLFRYL